jgi:bis(5'-nucleosyl)-tetraphosphatase (symmetrical)
LRSSPPREFLTAMFGNEPVRWRESLTSAERLRFTLNTLTRIRFVSVDGTLEFGSKDGADTAPAGFTPWFEAPGRKTAATPIAFGHWSTLGLLDRPNLLGLDTGCVWGGKLTAARIDGARREIVQVDCDQAQEPG